VIGAHFKIEFRAFTFRVIARVDSIRLAVAKKRGVHFNRTGSHMGMSGNR